MGNLLEPGGGVPTAALVQLWRTVYRKGLELAEARARQLLGDHVQAHHGRRALAVVLDGGGAALQPGTKCDLELPWAYVVEGWALYADQPGSVVVDLRLAADYGDFPGAVASICAGAPPTLAGQQKRHHEGVVGWTTGLPRGGILRVVVVSAATVELVTLTLLLRAV